MLVALAGSPHPADAQTVPSGFVIENPFPGATFNLPVQTVFMPDGRKLIVEKEGRIWVMNTSGAKLATPFIDINTKVLSNDDRGLLGVALDPDFTTNRWVYLLFTVDPDSNAVDDNVGAYARLERYKTNASNPNVLDLSTRQVLIGPSWDLGIPEPPRNRHHMVGTLRFAPDKTLLVGSGDAANADQVDAGGTDPLTSYGAGKTDPAEDIGSFRSQTLNSMDGKILRVDKETGWGLSSNPFWDANPISDRSRVWLYGLRNPFRFSIRPGTGSTDPAAGDVGVLYIGDVGWNTTEELSIARQGGLNFGWPCMEGAYPQSGYQAIIQTYFHNSNVLCSAAPSAENPRSWTPPALWWDHSDSTRSNPVGWAGNCSIGGVFYTGTIYPASYQNVYYQADYGRGWIRTVQVDANDNVIGTGDFLSGGGGIVDVESEPTTGDLWYIDINTNAIRRIRYSPGNQPPVVNASVTPTSGNTPLTVTVTASGSSDPDGDPLSYLWSFGTGWTSTKPDTSYTYSSQGTYNPTVTVSDGRGGSTVQPFTVVAGQTAPPGTILSPPDLSFFHQNQAVSLQAATAQGAASYRWDIDLHHNEHIHPSTETYFGANASFVPTTPNDGERYSLRIRLGVTQGSLTTSDTVEIYPQLNLTPVSLTFDPATPGRNDPIQLTAHISSVGEVGTSPSTYQVKEGSTVLASGALPAIPNGSDLDVTVALGTLSLGQHAIQFVVDPTNVLFETSESDNAITANLTVGGLVAAYSFDQGTGSTLTDLSGNGNNGTIVLATWTNQGKFGKALTFNGTGAYVDLGNAPLLQMTGSMTCSAWVRASSNPPDDGQIVAKSDNSGGWQLKSSPDSGLETFGMAVFGAANSYTGRYTSTVRSLNTWYHIAGVYDATAHSLSTYVNGVLDNGLLIGFVPTSQMNSSANANIGRRTGGYYFSGTIDELRIYNRALTQAEIQTDMNTSVASQTTVGVGSEPRAGAADFAIGLGVPNPFRTRTDVSYAISRESRVRIEVFDVFGQRVATLVDRVQPAGRYHATFTPRGLASGVYLCRLESGGFVAARKLLLLR